MGFWDFWDILDWLNLSVKKCVPLFPSVKRPRFLSFSKTKQDNDHSPPLADKDLLVEDCPVGAEEGDRIERLSVLWLLQI